jgi:histidine triad (HIT) family protein
MENEIESSIFAKIVRGEITVPLVYEDEHVLAFNDINPQAPVHVLVVPKKAVRNVGSLTESDTELAGRVLLACAAVARQVGIAEDGFRVVLNTGEQGGQSVAYLHAHVIGGKQLGWTPA